jgi:hypothetical protein
MHGETKSEVGAAAIACNEFIFELENVEQVTDGGNTLSGSYFARRGFGALQMYETFGALQIPTWMILMERSKIIWN